MDVVNYYLYLTYLNGTLFLTNIRKLFNGCNNLSSLPDISKWDTNKVTDMSYIFNGCSNLSSLLNVPAIHQVLRPFAWA